MPYYFGILAESRADLVKKLGVIEQGGIIFSTVGKFDKENLPSNKRNNIIVITDEAHRGHYGLYETVHYIKDKETQEMEAVFKYGVEKYIRDALPNATFIGFTGTPVNTKDKQTTDNIKCTALTKGILPIELAQLSKKNEYGITLISLNEDFSKVIEPNAASYVDRIAALRALHNAGCKTWVSIEPYPTPNFIEQNFDEILQAIAFCDKIIFGRLNYNKKVSEYKGYKQFFNDLAQRVINFCEANGKQYHIKTGTISE